MESLFYVPLTAAEVVLALRYSDCDEMTGEFIARELLAGVEMFTSEELSALAAYRDVSIESLTELDPAFRRYADPCTALRKSIAVNALNRGIDAEIAADICGLPPEKVRKLK